MSARKKIIEANLNKMETLLSCETKDFADRIDKIEEATILAVRTNRLMLEEFKAIDREFKSNAHC